MKLADPQYYKPGSIDVLLGAEVHAQIILDGIKRHNSLIALNSRLGWIISGRVTQTDAQPHNIVVAHIKLEVDQFRDIKEYLPDKKSMSNKKIQFSPRYMYSGRVYPRYLSGTAYALSAAAAHALYRAALHTPYFHLEDVYITGMCALRSSPPIAPSGAAGFSPRAPRRAPCVAHAAVTSHRVTPEAMRRITEAMLRTQHVDRCERMRLTQMSSRESWVKALNKKVFSFWR
ncbi:hypothetical protein JYU34_000879 [Plutella xylostella]|uniref:Hexosyltransferase n=1 Tax=Plutella xylostella TaxID=51655 RepID=A0ABQ7R5K5_PLUXY|nr:hypothetical protein JYU34_000879 [Plutella xylostella]